MSKIACRSLKPLLLDSVCHQLLLGTLWADDVLPVRDEALAHHAALAGGADETVVVPVTTLERNETGSTNPCHWLVLRFRKKDEIKDISKIDDDDEMDAEEDDMSMQVLPVMGLLQAVHLLENNSPKQSAQ